MIKTKLKNKMLRPIPIANKLLQRKWEDKQDERYVRKLIDAKSMIDLRSPSSFGSKDHNPKKA